MNSTFQTATLAGERVLLDAERALVWPRQATMFVADLHLGKDQVFREHGLALPDGVASADLDRLTSLVKRHDVRRLIVLGDLMHGKTAASASWAVAFRAWRAAFPDLAVLVVRGNHDRPMPDVDGFDFVPGGLALGPFVLHHEPRGATRGYVLAGHIHPGVVLRDRYAPSIRTPAFWLGPQRTILPAFGCLTGLARRQPDAADRVFACVGHEVVEVRRR